MDGVGLGDFYTVDDKPVDSIQGLLEKVTRLGSGHTLGKVCLRGQGRADWGLLPTIGRPGTYHYGGKAIRRFTNLQERELLHRFKRHLYGYLNREPRPWENMFLARHHGLPVRLLDWTANPLVALYWACQSSESTNGDGAVWAFRRREQDHDFDVFAQSAMERSDPLQTRSVRIVHPFHISPRMGAQSSLFTIQNDPWTGLEHYNPTGFPPAEFDVDKLEKWVVTKDMKGALLQDLELFGINSRTLFPDLDGLCRGLVETEILRTGEAASE